jgi:hypothetical protein
MFAGTFTIVYLINVTGDVLVLPKKRLGIRQLHKKPAPQENWKGGLGP